MGAQVHLPGGCGLSPAAVGIVGARLGPLVLEWVLDWRVGWGCVCESAREVGRAAPLTHLSCCRADMAPYYEALCKSLDWQMDVDLLSKMKKANEEELRRLDEELEDAEKNLGESEIRDAMMAKAEYLCRIGDKEGALTAFRKTYDKTVALGHRLDIVFYLLRIGLFYMDNDLITRNTEKAKSLIEEGGDWDRRNRLKVYQGLYCVAIRDFKQAAELFLDTVSTFTSYELMDYKTFVTYTVYVSMIALERPDLREKVIKGAEILEVLHSLPAVRQYLFSLYECRYSVFFQSLAVVEQEMKKDWLFAPHYRYYVREMRIHAYSQLLESYRSLTLGYMAEAFGVGVEFIDQELSRFIAAGRLHCKIDKVNEIVETNRYSYFVYHFRTVSAALCHRLMCLLNN